MTAVCTNQLNGHLGALKLTASMPLGITKETANWAAKELERINRLRGSIGDCATIEQVDLISQSNEAVRQTELRMRELKFDSNKDTD